MAELCCSAPLSRHAALLQPSSVGHCSDDNTSEVSRPSRRYRSASVVLALTSSASLLLVAAAVVVSELPLQGHCLSSDLATSPLTAAAQQSLERAKQRVANGVPSRVIRTTSGDLQGVHDEHFNLFLGIPFAKPPVNGLRWKSPQPVTPWSGVRNATWFGSVCPQSEWYWAIPTTMSEDCLYLNVYTPPNATAGSNLPVILFFYGGSWKYGSASFPLYWANQDIRDVDDVIWVTTNYRLNIFGFLASEALKRESSDGSVGNYGLEDQRAAMKWIHDNIYNFGGDPSRVTIQGESAGAGSVSNHLISPPSAGLFQRAIIESGPWAVWTAQPLNTSAVKYDTLAEHAGCASSALSPGGGLRGETADPVVDCLRSKSTKELMAANHGLPSGLLEWSPVIDGINVPGVPQQLAQEGKINNVPVLLGTNHDEGTLFVHLPHDLNATQFQEYVIQKFGSLGAPKIIPQYPLSKYPSPWWAASHVFGDAAMSCPARRSARWLTGGPNAQPVFLYFYQHVLEIVKLFLPYYGCFHGSELPFVYDLKLALWTAEERTLALQFVRYWTRFAAYGDPNGGEDPVWPTYSNATDTAMVLDVPKPFPKSGLKQHVCDMWDKTPVPSRAVWGLP